MKTFVPCQPFWKRYISDLITKDIPLPSHRNNRTFTNVYSPRKTIEKKKKIPQVWFSAKTSLNNKKSIIPNDTIFDDFLTLPTSDEAEANKNPMKSIKIRIYPTKEQKKTLQLWMNATRYTYNLCVTHINDLQENRFRPPIMKTALETEMRRLYVGREGVIKTDPSYKWMKSVPQEIRDNGLRDVKKAIASHYAKQWENRTKFQLKYRSIVYDNYQTILIAKRQWSLENGKVTKLLKNTTTTTKKGQHIPDELYGDSRILLHKSGKWYFHTPVPLEIKSQHVPTRRIVALDPGVRTFMTCYDQFGTVTEYGGNGDNSRMFKRAMTIDKLVSRSKDVKRSRNSRRNHRKSAAKLRMKIKTRVDDMHHRVANHLLQNNDVILIPSFNVKNMVSKKMQRRLLPKSTVRQMLHWAHYRFRQYLLNKVREYPGKQVIVVTEEYTSKTCGQCGTVHHHLGCNKQFTCPNSHCRFTMSRDWNGARNVLIKYMTENCDRLIV